VSEGGIPSELPKGWAWATLDEVSESVRNGIFVSRPGTEPAGVPILRIGAVRPLRLDLSDLRYSGQSVEELQAGDRLVLPGDLLFTRYNGNPELVGACVAVPGAVPALTYPDKLIRVRVDRRLVVPEFVAYAFSWKETRAQVREHVKTTAGQAGIAGGELKRIRLPVPPLEEQWRIVVMLEEQMSRLDAADLTLQVSGNRIDRYLQSMLHRMMSTHAPVQLREVLACGLSNGRSVPTRAGGFPVLRLTALSDTYVDLAQHKEGDWEESEATPFLIQQGDFLIARGNGSLSLVGRGSLVVDSPNPVAYPDTMIRARPDASKILPEYLPIIWSSLAVRHQIESQARTTAGIYKVNQKILEAIEFPLPDLPTQQALCAQWSNIEQQVRHLGHTVSISKRRSATLRRSLLAKAFAGHLVPQDPADEPVEALLDRIRAEREVARATKSRRRNSRRAPAQRTPDAAPVPDAPPPLPAGTPSHASATQTNLDLEISS